MGRKAHHALSPRDWNTLLRAQKILETARDPAAQWVSAFLHNATTNVNVQDVPYDTE